MDRNGLALDAAIAGAPGVTPLRRHPMISRQCSYNFAFNYDNLLYDELDVAIFRQALSAELGIAAGGPYEPLNNSPLYFPHRKWKFSWSKEFVQAITPMQWHLPVAEGIVRNRGVVIGWRVLGCPLARAHLLADAIAKIHENRKELLSGKQTTERLRSADMACVG
jgi:hypothetical protein